MLEARKIRLVMELRQQGITDQAVLSAIEKVPREAFVPESFHDQAYENTALPIGHGQTISQPSVVGFMTQALEIGPRMKILEVGTGCGYQAAVLAGLCRRVYSIERFRELLREAEKRLLDLRVNNVTTKWGDGASGWPEQAPFDRMILTAAATEVPQELLDQMSENGIIIAPVGETSREQTLIRMRHMPDNTWEKEELWPVRFVPMLDGKVGDNSEQ
ncbi:MAG: protein-L-isoaspartate O-methyltransferase [Rhodospirillaceae bacterium]|nr:protein-L-isoaspartate O-methyltransferase [Rhodospirillaceae bacterium]|tara:strand:+ start:29974 stop:30624 length:651 start_codon:yes stop_codon:yes gene_type:complete